MDADNALDFRRLPVWDRAEKVLGQIERLEVGETFTFRMELNPRALVTHIEQQRPLRFAFDIVRQGIEDWRVIVLRVPVNHAGDAAGLFERNPALRCVSRMGRDHLKRSMSEATMRKGTVLSSEDEPRDSLHVISEGAVGVFAGAEQRERLLFDLHAPDFAGEVELLDGGWSIGRTVVLSRNAHIVSIPYEVLRVVMEREPELVSAFALSAAQHVRMLASALAQQTNQPILERIAIALLPYAAPERGMQPAFAPLPNMTQTQLAAAAGTVKEVAARAIAELESLGALQRERGHVAYLDRAKLLAIIDRG